MKKTFLTVCCICLAATSSYGQFRIASNGNISINSSETPLSTISLGSAGYDLYNVSIMGDKCGIYSLSAGEGLNWGYAGDFRSYVDGYNFAVGIKGDVKSKEEGQQANGRAFGVFGSAGFATSGWNYGVYGRLMGTSYGAGVYGTSSNSENGTYVDGRYAGYFNGNTKVKGNLTVTGSINGVILSPSAQTPTTSLQTYTGTDAESIVDKMARLNAMEYYNEMPAFANATISGDTATAVPTMTEMEAMTFEKKHYALSADALEEVYPDLVYENADGSKSINYVEMVPLLVQSINELNAKIAVLEHNASNESNTSRGGTTSMSEDIDTDIISLSQNKPNPFSDKTTIRLSIPENITKAILCIYDMNGTQIKQIEMSERGQFSQDISSTGLENGMYLYSLIADGKLISTKRMIILK